SQWIDRGVGRVVVGTAAVLSPDMLKAAAKQYPDQIVLAVDIFRGKVVTNGWRMPSLYTPADFIRNFETDPLAAVIVTDIDAKVEDAEDALALVTDLAGRTRHPVIARGMARSLDDISRLKYVPNIAGAIVGNALFDRSIDLGEAIAVCEERVEAAAPFI
ncbi:MAG: HisA/HisF-related TIM barrel protein, partial [Boseongicola sp.]